MGSISAHFTRSVTVSAGRSFAGARPAAESRVPIDGEVALSVDITNTGERSGSEVVQVYVRDKVATQVRPLQELKAFQRVTLSPGETATLTFTLPVEMFNFTRRDGKRIVEPKGV